MIIAFGNEHLKKEPSDKKYFKTFPPHLLLEKSSRVYLFESTNSLCVQPIFPFFSPLPINLSITKPFLTYFVQSNGQGPTIITITIIITNVIAIITVLIVIIIITENLIIARFHNNFPKAKKQLRLIRVLTLQVGPNVYIGDDDDSWNTPLPASCHHCLHLAEFGRFKHIGQMWAHLANLANFQIFKKL